MAHCAYSLISALIPKYVFSMLQPPLSYEEGVRNAGARAADRPTKGFFKRIEGHNKYPNNIVQESVGELRGALEVFDSLVKDAEATAKEHIIVAGREITKELNGVSRHKISAEIAKLEGE